MFYALVNPKTIQIHNVKKMLSLKQMQELVGIEGESAYIEVSSYRSYSDKSIVIVADDGFLLNHFSPTCVTAEGTVLHGQVLVLGIDLVNNDFSLLTEKQARIVQEETRLYQNLRG